MSRTLERLIPSVGWLRRYERADLPGDLTAGLTTAVLLVPQGMAYAMLAGLPPIIGLYASIVPLAVYALLGTSRQLAVGPVAIDSLLVAAGTAALAEPGSPEAVQIAILLALMVGALQLGMGVLRMGFMTNFLSHPVISGFTSAAALVIGASQLSHLTGLHVPSGLSLPELLATLAQSLGELHVATLILGAGSVTALVLLKRHAPRVPRALVVVAATTLAAWLLGLDQQGVAIVGAVPGELPRPALPALDPATLTTLLPTALTIALVGFMEAISVGRAMARRHRYDVAPNQELIALGAANLAAGVFGAYPTTGGLSRTAVNDQAGARTPLASLITAAVVALTVLFLTPLFHFLPKAALAAIIIAAVVGLIDTHEVRFLWRTKRSDLALLVLTFVATLALGIVEGIVLGVAASVAWFVVRSTRPHTAILGQLPGTEVYRNLDRFPEARRVPGMMIVRVDAPFYFGNVTFLKDTVARLRSTCPEQMRALIIDASSINELDSSAVTALGEIADEADASGFGLYFAGAKGPVRDVMQRAGFWDRLGEAHFQLRVHDAVEYARAHLDVPDAPRLIA